MKKTFLIFISYISFLHVHAQEDEGEILHAIQKGYNPEYRVNYFNKMILKMDIYSDVDNFYIPKLNYTDDSQSAFVPNTIFKTKFSFDYKFIGLFISFSPDFLPGNSINLSKGKTQTLDLSFKFFYNDRLRQEVVYKNIKGFYLANPKTGLPIELFGDLEIQTIGGKIFYITNNNFSYRAFETLTERQIKSAGSIIPSISFYYNNLITNKKNETESYLTRIKSYDAILQVGYMYNYVFSKKWFSTIGFDPGIGINESNNYFANPINDKITSKTSVNINLNFDASIALGYNNKNFFSGLKLNYKNIEYNTINNAEIINSKVNFGIFVGYRFKEIKPIKQILEKFEKRIGI
jgi:hypothetical protein